MFLSPFKLKDQVDYTPNQFNSEVLVEDGDRKIMLIAMEAHQELPEHFSPLNAYIYVLKGEVIFEIDDIKYNIEEKYMFIIPANTKHKAFAKEKSKFMVIRL